MWCGMPPAVGYHSWFLVRACCWSRGRLSRIIWLPSAALTQWQVWMKSCWNYRMLARLYCRRKKWSKHFMCQYMGPWWLRLGVGTSFPVPALVHFSPSGEGGCLPPQTGGLGVGICKAIGFCSWPGEGSKCQSWGQTQETQGREEQSTFSQLEELRGQTGHGKGQSF